MQSLGWARVTSERGHMVRGWGKLWNPRCARNTRAERVRWLVCLLCVVLVGCPQETTFLDPGEDPSDGGTQGIQRASLTVTATLTGEDSVVASRLGYEDGVLPGAEVTIERSGADASEQTGVTDASGQVRFDDLLEGIWSISFVRLLTPEETAQFDSADADVNAFGGATAVTLSPPGMDVSVGATAGRRGSLVISEISLPIARLPSGEDYRAGQWLELYNNSDTTIYLDGKVIVRAITFVRDYEPGLDCESHARWQLDAEGIWTNRWVEEFPGTGQTYPLEPGEYAVVAINGADLTEIHPGLQDLSDADFEFIGPIDVDNPSVPNMIRRGRVFGGGIPQVSQGMEFGLVDVITVVADHVVVGSLLSEDIPVFADPESWRIPAEKILDLIAIGPTPQVEQGADFYRPQCPQWLNERFERQRGSLIDHGALDAIKRRALTTLPSGQRILLRTKTTARDFQRGPPTPGR